MFCYWHYGYVVGWGTLTLINAGLARVALVMDKVMSRIGLQGKSFLPLMSSYACAVPGIMATRTIENRRGPPRHDFYRSFYDLQRPPAGRLGTLMEPVIQPLGFNWRIGAGLISAQVAREVMVSTLATISRQLSRQGHP